MASRATLDVSGSLNASKTLRGRSVIVGERSRGFKDDDKGDLGLFYGVLEGHIGENTKVTAGLLHQRHTETPDYFGVPMSVGGGDAGFNTDTYLGYDWTHAKFRKTNAFAELEHYFNDDWVRPPSLTIFTANPTAVLAQSMMLAPHTKACRQAAN